MADRVVMMSAEQAAREELAKAMQAMAANPLSETVPGGEYVNAAGETVNAHGQPLARAEREADAASEPMADDAEPARKAASHKRR